jgi:hypothetical protein
VNLDLSQPKDSPLDLRAVVAAIAGWLCVLLVSLDIPVPVRVVLVFGFCMFGPGLPWVLRLRSSDLLEVGVLAMAVSVCLSALLAEAMALAGMWSPLGALSLLAALTTIGAFFSKARPIMPGAPLPTWARFGEPGMTPTGDGSNGAQRP